MKTKSLLAIAAFAAIAFTAQAQPAVVGDLILGFKPATGTTNVEADLGAIGNFTSLAPGGTLALGNLNSVLTSAYGSDWATNTTTGLTWGVAGNAGLVANAVPGEATRTAWATSKWDTTTAGTLGVQNSVAYGSFSSSALGTTNTKVAAVYSSVTSPVVTVTNGVWGTNAPFNLTGSDFSGNAAYSLALGQNYSAADLYRLAVSTVPSGILGTFALYQNGDVTFTSLTVIPEPTTYAAILGLATLGFVAIRRRNQVAAQV